MPPLYPTKAFLLDFETYADLMVTKFTLLQPSPSPTAIVLFFSLAIMLLEKKFLLSPYFLFFIDNQHAAICVNKGPDIILSS